MKQRERLCEFYSQATNNLLDSYDVDAAHELGNYDRYGNKILIENNAEMNIFFDYIALYQKVGSKRNIVAWRLDNPDAINKDNKKVVSELERSRFAVLRLDEHLDRGAIRVTNLITQEENILMDRALHASKKEGCFFVCSVLNMGDYIMTSGGGIPVDPRSSGGKSFLTLLKPCFDKLKKARSPFTKEISSCVRSVYGFCLKNDMLMHMTVE